MEIPIIGDQCAQFAWHFYSAPDRADFEWSDEDVPAGYISLEAFSERVGKSIAALYDVEIRTGKLPIPERIPGNRRGWRKDHVEAFAGNVILGKTS